MSYVSKTDYEWLKQHAEQDAKGFWHCKVSGFVIQTVQTGRSLHVMRGAGYGEVARVDHLWCKNPACGMTQPEISYGEPIQLDDLLEW